MRRIVRFPLVTFALAGGMSFLLYLLGESPALDDPEVDRSVGLWIWATAALAAVLNERRISRNRRD